MVAWEANVLAGLKSLFSSRKTQLSAYTITGLLLSTIGQDAIVKAVIYGGVALICAVLIHAIALEDAAAKGAGVEAKLLK